MSDRAGRENKWYVDSVSGHTYRDLIDIKVEINSDPEIETSCNSFMKFTIDGKISSYTCDLAHVKRGDHIKVMDLNGVSMEGKVSSVSYYRSGGFSSMDIGIEVQ